MELNSTKTDLPSMNRPKKARYSSLWESSLYQKVASGKSLSLYQLFDTRNFSGAASGRRRRNNRRKEQFWKKSSCCNASSINTNKQRQSSHISFRLEHREGGAMATHPGEERILLFRSDQPGAIAKIIFSSSPPSQSSSSPSSDGEDRLVQAKIHVLDVKELYRGFDLGSLLFTEALLALKHRYKTPIRCQLDAEEDIRRHNKLVKFYQRLGCNIKPQARPQFLNNNDGETYRKVTMQIDLKDTSSTKTNESTAQHSPQESLIGASRGFLPVVLLDSRSKPGKIAHSDGSAGGESHSTPTKDADTNTDTINAYRVDWLLVEDEQGYIQFRTTHGRYLTIDSNGKCTEDESPGDDDHLSKFQLLRVLDSNQQVLSGDDEDDDYDKSHYYSPQKQQENSYSRDRELWVLLSPHGTFLSLDPDSCNLYGSKAPAFWQTNSMDFSLTCTPDTPTRRQHYRRTWTKQTVDFVMSARERYLQFKLGQLDIKSALDLLKGFSAFPFRLDSVSRNTSLRTLAVSKTMFVGL